MPASAPSSDSTSRIDAVDGLRGLAILSVMIGTHYLSQRWFVFDDNTQGWPHLIGAMFKLTNTGVNLFFLLSGFLLARILFKGKRTAHTDTFHGKLTFFKTFFIRRVARIFPLFYANVLILAGMLYAYSRWNLTQFDWLFEDALPLWSYLTYMQNNVMAATHSFGAEWMAVSWSLAVEEQFYLILPFFILMMPQKWIPRVLVVGILVGPLCRAAAGLLLNGTAAIVLLPSCVDAFSFGILIAYAAQDEGWTRWLKQFDRWWGWLAAAMMIAAVLIAHFGDALDIGAVVIAGYWFMSAGFAALLLHVTHAPAGSPIERLLTANWTRWLGIRCYSIYLFHQPVIGLLGGWLLGDSAFELNRPAAYGVALLAAATTFALAQVLWVWVERPLIAWGHQFHYTPQEAATVPLPITAAGEST